MFFLDKKLAYLTFISTLDTVSPNDLTHISRKLA